MMRALAISACLVLAGCATATDEAGVANYDALRKATADCTAKGGELQLSPNLDPQRITSFTCKRK